MKILAIVIIAVYGLLSLYGATKYQGGDKIASGIGGVFGILLFVAYTWAVWYLSTSGGF